MVSHVAGLMSPIVARETGGKSANYEMVQVGQVPLGRTAVRATGTSIRARGTLGLASQPIVDEDDVERDGVAFTDRTLRLAVSSAERSRVSSCKRFRSGNIGIGP